MRLTALLSLAVALLPAAVCANTASRSEHHAESYVQSGDLRQTYPDDNYLVPASYGSAVFHTAHTNQSYQLAAKGKRWEDMDPREQEQIRQRKEKYESLPARDKERIRQAKERYERMPPERREQIRERWEKMPADKKERYRLERKER